jgi:hypothetical protein
MCALQSEDAALNIFFLDRDPEAAARLHSDQHVIKMALESAQILCSALHRHGVAAPYKPTHAGHPSVLWAGDSLPHWLWVRRLGLALCDEYGLRFGKTHACRAVILSLPSVPAIADRGWTDPPLVMPEPYQAADPVQSYRSYYRAEKLEFGSKGRATWRIRGVPAFIA